MDDGSWANYPLNNPLYEPLLYHGAEIRGQLSKAPTLCFQAEERNGSGSLEKPATRISLRVIDVKQSFEDLPTCSQQLCKSEEDVQNYVLDAVQPRIRIISIHSYRTNQPLLITSGLMRKVLNRYHVAPEFVPIVFSFGENTEIAESGNSNIYIQPGHGKSKHLSYEIRYVEKNNRNNEWSHRHTGVYHHHDPRDKQDLFILLQSNASSTAESRLLDIVRKGKEDFGELSKMCDNPYRVHLLLASSYFPNWRWYLRGVAKEFSRKNDAVMTVDPEDPSVTYRRVQSLRNLQDKVIEARAHCHCDLQVLRGIMRVKDRKVKQLHQLLFHAKQLEGFLDGSEVLRDRINNTIELIGYTLDHHNQLEAAKQSTIVTLITLVTAFYLPGSFAATFYGMNFFSFDTNSSQILVSHDIWKFAVTWIPLMIFTFFMYIIAAVYQDYKHGKPTPWLGIKAKKHQVHSELD